MNKYWSELVRNIEPYVPGEQPLDRKYIKLNANENPYPPSPMVIEAIKSATDESLRLYPDPDCNELRMTIAEYYQLYKDQVFVSNGSDELLSFAFMAFFLEKAQPILFPDITYSFYPVYSALYRVKYQTIPLCEDFSIPLDQYLIPNGGIIIPNPNAPTGRAEKLDAISNLLKNNPDSVIIIDEAYIDFGGESCVGLIDEFPNLLVIGTLSKSRCLAGLRSGYALGNRDLIIALDRIKNSINSYTLDRLALAGSVQAFLDKSYFADTCNKIINTRIRVIQELEKLGFFIIPSCANFIFISHKDVKALDLQKYLKDNSILVRYFNQPRIDNFLRVSIGSEPEMDTFIEVLRKKIKRG